MTITGTVILTILNLFLWFLTFFKSKKMIREKKVGKHSWEISYTPWKMSNERYRFPMWLFCIGTLILIAPPVATFLYIVGYIAWGIIHTTNDDNFMGLLELERPRLFLQDFFNKKV